MNLAHAPKHTLPKAEHGVDDSSILVGVLGVPVRASHPLLVAVSTHELVQKDRQKELDRIINHTNSDQSADYASYVLLPLILLVGVLVGLRRLLAL